MTQIEKIFNPVVGILGSTATAILPFFNEYVLPGLQIAGVVIGLAVGVTSLILNVRRMRRK